MDDSPPRPRPTQTALKAAAWLLGLLLIAGLPIAFFVLRRHEVRRMQKTIDQWDESSRLRGEARDAERGGELGRAVAAWSRAIEIDPTDWFAWLGRAETRARLGHEEEALADFAEAEARGAMPYYIWVGRALSRARFGRWKQMKTEAAMIRERNPGDPVADGLEGWALLGEGDAAKALPLLTAACEVTFLALEFRVQRMRALAALGHLPAASQAALSLSGSDELDYEMLDEVLAVLYEAGDEPALKARAGTAEAWLTLITSHWKARGLWRDGKHDDAQAAYAAALRQADPMSARAVEIGEEMKRLEAGEAAPKTWRGAAETKGG